MTASIDSILDRLVLNYREIAGIKRAARLAESTPLELEEVPYVYSLVGPTVGSTPNRQAGFTVQRRYFLARCLVAPVVDSDQGDGLGAESTTRVVPFIMAFTAYFIAHPRFDTVGTVNEAKLPALQWIPEDVTFTDGGPRKIAGPGGTEYAGFDFTMTIALQLKTGRSS